MGRLSRTHSSEVMVARVLPVLLLTCMSGEAAGWAGMSKVRELIRDIVRPNPPDEDYPAPLLGAEPVGVYQRKTQAPVVWLNLRKSRLPMSGRAWYNAPYQQDAKQRLGVLGAEVQEELLG